jgi:hypothetical protein
MLEIREYYTERAAGTGKASEDVLDDCALLLLMDREKPFRCSGSG